MFPKLAVISDLVSFCQPWSCAYRRIHSTCCVLHKISETHEAAKAQSRPSHLNVFDRNAKLLHRRRASIVENSEVFDYLKDEVGFILADRVPDIKRELNLILDLGCGRGHFLKHLDSNYVSKVVAADLCEEALNVASPPDGINCEKIVLDEEEFELESDKFDMVASCLNLHWVNNLPKVFFNILKSLKPDGAFLGAIFGCQTLYELRCSMQLAELEREGGMASHISPFAEVQDIGGLLSINGFTMLTVDTQEIKVNFPSMFELLEDLKGMAENNASWRRPLRFSKDSLLAASAIYKEMYGNEDGSIPATFQIIYMIAWKPDPSQPKPLDRQKPNVSLKELADFEERKGKDS